MITDLQLTDLPQMVAIEHAAALSPWSRRMLQQSLISDHCYGLVLDSVLQGFAVFSLVADELSLLDIAIAPGSQGRGLGRNLLLAGLHRGQANGARQCFLEVRVSNLPAIRLYQSLGFNSIGVRKNYYPCEVGREDALVMALALEQLGENIE
jgi:ribosomal-protein-alanine N-acetyltransferase